jgi:lipopolysaccharide transport protein LptA
MAGMVAFLVLGCISAGAQDHRDKPGFSKDPIGPLMLAPVPNKDPIGPLIWGPVYKPGVDKTYLSLGFGSDSDQPIDITSETSRISGRRAVFEGNVKVKHGDVTLTCDRLVMVYDEKNGERTKKRPKAQENASQIKSIIASGKVMIRQNERMASAAEVVYDNVKRTILLKGGPACIWDGPESLKGGQIIINLDEYSSDMPVKYCPIPHKNMK